ncbi:Golgi SNAP receptor complex member 2 [Octopus bimaculoides]|uniref:Golgi SNAP receptor complex member 2 n=1 Tax=Octopus bimaculoides TaxID=37653 RepID=A0A0L8GRT4_OCTBM|nr:Golgi SNAP receptor complex member 2 [Octopus bimaculoides]XP_014778612.1 Golgi SNAP receptor complex member 2 [Octopus bimaculoides]|eukprot:XP_014778610.1 PREDICTED: Golgi SNAP receptor complex member 2-like [Octopus bimaculoides]
MDNLYHQTNKLVQEVWQNLSALERATDQNVHIIENDIQAHIDMITSHCERLDLFVNKEPVSRRAVAKMKVDQLKYDCQHLQTAMRHLQHKRYRREEEEREREALLSRKFTTNDENTSIEIDHALRHNTQLQNSHHGIDDLLGAGSNVLSSLKEQSVTLKGTHKKILDIANMLGLSNTVMRLIEKRSSQDKIILFVGMLVTCLIMYIVIAYLI